MIINKKRLIKDLEEVLDLISSYEPEDHQTAEDRLDIIIQELKLSK